MEGVVKVCSLNVQHPTVDSFKNHCNLNQAKGQPEKIYKDSLEKAGKKETEQEESSSVLEITRLENDN